MQTNLCHEDLAIYATAFLRYSNCMIDPQQSDEALISRLPYGSDLHCISDDGDSFTVVHTVQDMRVRLDVDRGTRSITATKDISHELDASSTRRTLR